MSTADLRIKHEPEQRTVNINTAVVSYVHSIHVSGIRHYPAHPKRGVRRPSDTMLAVVHTAAAAAAAVS